MAERVGLLGGLFDPVHSGHISIVESFLASGTIDELWLVPSSNPPHKDVRQSTSFDHRFHMLQRAFASFPKCKIIDVEHHLPSPGYTLQTLTHLQRMHPNIQFMWCTGSDNLKTFDQWHEYEQILSNWMLLVAARPDYGIDSVPQQIKKRCIMVPHQPTGESSTAVRLQLNKTGRSQHVPDTVLEYIKLNALYTG